MPLPGLHVWAPDDDFLDIDINGNFETIANKFSTTSGVGISDDDIATDADISGLKLSNASGKQIPEDRIAKDAVTHEKLRSSTSVDASRAVTTDHIRNEAVTKGKGSTVAGQRFTKAQLEIATQSKSFGPYNPGFGGVESVTIRLTTNAGNYRAELHIVYNSGAEVTQNVDPTTPIPAATNTIIGLYFDSLSGMGGSVLSASVVFVSVANS